MEFYGVRHNYPEPSGFCISRPHGREDYTFIQFLTEAQVEVAGHRCTASPGACVFYPPHAPQFFEARTPFLHNWLHADASLDELLTRYGVPQDCLFYPHNPAFISELLGRMEAEYVSTLPARDVLLESYMTELVIKLSRDLSRHDIVVPSDSVHTRPLRALRQRLLEHPEQHLSVETMAAQLSMSPSRFHAVYRALFGTSPVKDMICARIHRAKTVLEHDPDIKIHTLAHRLGYTEQCSFIRQFRAIVGMSPDRYRRIYAQGAQENDKMH